MSDHKLVYAPTLDSDDECFFRAALGTPLPSDALDVLDSNFEGHGYMGEEGFRNNITRETTKHYSFGGRHVKTTQDRYEETITASFYEHSPNVLATVFGDDNVTVDLLSGHRKMTVRHADKPLPLSSFVIRTVDGEDVIMYVVPEGRITEIDEVEIRHDALYMYTVTIDCYRPANGTLPDNPECVNVYYDQPNVASGT